jgi:hypothetical protein
MGQWDTWFRSGLGPSIQVSTAVKRQIVVNSKFSAPVNSSTGFYIRSECSSFVFVGSVKISRGSTLLCTGHNKFPNIRASVVVKALCYKPEGRGFEPRWSEYLNLTNLSGSTRHWGFTQPVTEMSTRNRKIIMFLGSKVRSVRMADNLPTIYEPFV